MSKRFVLTAIDRFGSGARLFWRKHHGYEPVEHAAPDRIPDDVVIFNTFDEAMDEMRHQILNPNSRPEIPKLLHPYYKVEEVTNGGWTILYTYKGNSSKVYKVGNANIIGLRLAAGSVEYYDSHKEAAEAASKCELATEVESIIIEYSTSSSYRIVERK